MSISSDREDLFGTAPIAPEPEQGTEAHKAWLAELSARNKAQIKRRERTERDHWVLAQEGNRYASHQFITNPASENNPYHSHSEQQRQVGAMSHGYGLQQDDGLIQVGEYRTQPSVAEVMRRGMSPEDWKGLTGREYTNVLLDQVRGPTNAPLQSHERELNQLQQFHQDGVDEERELAALEDQKRADAELLEESGMRAGAKGALERAVEATYGEEVGKHFVDDVVIHGELREAVTQYMGITEEQATEAIDYHMARVDTMVDGINSSSNMMRLALDEKQALSARKAYAAGDYLAVKEFAEVARDRIAKWSLAEIRDHLSPAQIAGIKLRDLGSYGVTVALPQVGEVSWNAAIRLGYIKF